MVNENWIRNRWGGFTYLLIRKNEDFMLDFKDGNLYLHCEDEDSTVVSRLLLFKNPSEQDIINAENFFINNSD